MTRPNSDAARAISLLLSDEVLAQKIAARLWKRIDKSGGPDACWPFNGARQMPKRPGEPKRYGAIFVPIASSVRVSLFTHRVAYVLHHQCLPEGGYVMHTCDNPPCCNPAHLRAGTPTDNARDMQSKGRRVAAAPRGEQHGNAKYTEAQVRECMRLAGLGKKPRAIAAAMGVPRHFPSMVLTGKAWTHVTGLSPSATPLNRKLSDADKLAMYVDTRSRDEIAAAYGVANTYVSTIRRRVRMGEIRMG